MMSCRRRLRRVLPVFAVIAIGSLGGGCKLTWWSLDRSRAEAIFALMSLLELKQQVSRLSPRERVELPAYLIRRKHGTPAWKRATAKRLRDRQAGKFTWIEALEARLAKG